MPNNPDANIATADVLTLLLHNQHGIAAALEELANWATRQGGPHVAENVVGSLQVLDTNAQAITNAINRLRQS
ncbi:hypothetical protein PMA3_20615 [Pseudomonas silesiensis]|uniref:Uncharacterized protein n=1 Tax=Pseudomonas silesiensis TaxID=1853130 RepID=A0A191YX21_9PSED|nr:hypothetical protein [Pseudomonas silesiensis]ANJ57430.1 hypothetical protein PMA3_20615 [Pseudomonas silesiensis]